MDFSREIVRNLKEPLVKNASVIIITRGLTAVVGFLFWVVVARFYDISTVGLAAALFSAQALLTNFSSFGFHISLIRFLPGEQDKQGMINSILCLVAVISFLLAMVFVVGLPLWSPGLLVLYRDTILLIAFVVLVVVNTLIMMHRHIFLGLRSAELSMVQQAIWDLSRLGLLIALVPLGLLGIISSVNLGILIALVIGFLLMGRVASGYRAGLTVKKRVVNDMMHFSAVGYVAEILGTAGHYLLPLMIVSVLGTVASAQFYVAFRVAGILYVIPAAVVTSLFVEGAHEPQKLRLNTLRAAKLMSLLLVPSLLIIFFFGRQILSLFGQEYSQNALATLWMLSLAAIPIAIAELYVAVKRVSLEVSHTIYVYLFQAVLVTGIGYGLMAVTGLIGAGVGWAAGYGLVAAVLLVLLLRKGRWGLVAKGA